jgi:hypothetical protein
VRAIPDCGRLHAHRQTLEHASPCSESGTCAPERCSSPAAPFPPQPPRKVSLRCSAGSSVLWRSPTSPARACPPYGLWPSRTGLDPKTKACWRSPGSRACCFSACMGSIDYAGPDIGRVHIAILDAAEIDTSQGNGLAHPALDRRALFGIEGQTGCPSRNLSNSMTRSRMRPSAINSCGVLPAKASTGVLSQCFSSGATT